MFDRGREIVFMFMVCVVICLFRTGSRNRVELARKGARMPSHRKTSKHCNRREQGANLVVTERLK